MPIHAINHDTQKQILQQSGLVLFQWLHENDAIIFDIPIGCLFPTLTQELSLSTGRKFYRHIHKEDRVKIRSLLRGLKNENYHIHDIDIRYCMNSGEIIWLRLNILLSQQHCKNGLVGSIQNITKDKRNFLKTAYTAYTDDLTGLLNRVRMKQKTALALGASLKYDIQSIFIVISIDNLASINNMFGHHVADDLIQAVGNRLSFTKRKSDLIARLSSGKFGILLTDTHAVNLQNIGNRFLAAVRDTNFTTRSGSISITASGGGCIIPTDAITTDMVFSITDECLSIAKNRGRNNFIPYSAELTKIGEREENIKISGMIVSSIKENRICAAFQPVVNYTHPDKSFYEMLARIKERDGSLVPAYKFIPIAENTGFIRVIDLYILETALELLHKRPDMQFSINLSGHTLANHSLSSGIIDSLIKYKHVASRLIIEITETVALQDIHDMANFMQKIHDIGYRLALDDFGAGYNSFHNLKAFPFDLVKIDGEYVRDIHQDTRNQIFVRTLAEMSEQLGLEVVAEMISKPEEVEILKHYPIDYYQGFMFGKPEIDLNVTEKNMAESILTLTGYSHYGNKIA